jgi:hypothetical protein
MADRGFKALPMSPHEEKWLKNCARLHIERLEMKARIDQSEPSCSALLDSFNNPTRRQQRERQNAMDMENKALLTQSIRSES